MPSSYSEFILSKDSRFKPEGDKSIAPRSVNPKLKPFQKTVVKTALYRTRCAIFGERGMGKAFMILEWAAQVYKATSGNVLILAPLAVTHQIVIEAEKFGYAVTLCKFQEDVKPGINITNYERLQNFDRSQFAGLACDESSVFKGRGKYYQQCLEFVADMDYRLSASATPSPNELLEVVNQAEFLGICTGKQAIGEFFVQDGNSSGKYRLRNYARDSFWKWLCSWAIVFRKPSDLGNFSNEGYDLPKLHIHHISVDTEGEFFRLKADGEKSGINERRAARNSTLDDRVAKTAEIVNNSDEIFAVFCDLNPESTALSKSIPDAIEVTGSQKDEIKEHNLAAFGQGLARVIVTKPKIASQGLNWQHCRNMVFCGIGDSFEALIQSIGRIHRFGQTEECHVWIVASSLEGDVLENIKRKEALFEEFYSQGIRFMKEALKPKNTEPKQRMEGEGRTAEGLGWKIWQGDCIEQIDKLESNSVGVMVTSIPFPSMYTYSDDVRDLGNTNDIPTILEHLSYLIARDKLMRVMMPGSMVCVHLTQIPTSVVKDGYRGRKDFRGPTIQTFVEQGWIYEGDVTIDKCPQLQSIRNHDSRLQFKTLASDSSRLVPAQPDYMLFFSKPGERLEPVRAGTVARYGKSGWITEEEWIEWAAPVWYRQVAKGVHTGLKVFDVDVCGTPIANYPVNGYPGLHQSTPGIRETDVLGVKEAKDGKDERHLCPLQLSVIERCVKLYSNPGDLVLDPFSGIGSTGVKAIELDREYVGFELKPLYFDVSARNLQKFEQAKGQLALNFDAVAS